MFKRTIVLVSVIFFVCGCTPESQPPAKTNDPVASTTRSSTLAVPITIDLASLESLANSAVPAVLVDMKENVDACIPKKQAKICISPNLSCNRRLNFPFGGWTCTGWTQTGCGKYAITDVSPQIDCRVEGRAVRGDFAVTHQDNSLIVNAPVKLDFKANERGDIGKLMPVSLNAEANIFLSTALDVNENWQIQAQPELNYGWSNPPLLRIGAITVGVQDYADDAIKDKKGEVIGALQQELNSLDLEAEAQKLWEQAHTPTQLGDQNSPVWLALSPEKVGFSGLSYTDKEAVFTVLLAGETALTFATQAPPSRSASALPRLSKDVDANGFNLYVPLKIGFDQIHVQIEEALNKQNQFIVQDDALNRPGNSGGSLV